MAIAPSVRELTSPRDEVVGRWDFVRRVDQRISEGRSVVHVYGPPGIGKSLAVRKLGDQLRSRFEGGVYLLDAEPLESAESVLSLIDGRRRLVAGETPSGVRTLYIVDALDAVLSHDDQRNVDYLLEELRQWRDSVFLTVAQRACGPEQDRVRLHPMQIDDATELFEKSSNLAYKQEDQDFLREFLTEPAMLAGHPFSIALAGRNGMRTGLPLVQLVDSWRRYNGELLRDYPISERSLATSLAMALTSAMERSSQAGRVWLKRVLLALTRTPSGLDDRLCRSIWEGESVLAVNALGVLEEHGLVEVQKPTGGESQRRIVWWLLAPTRQQVMSISGEWTRALGELALKDAECIHRWVDEYVEQNAPAPHSTDASQRNQLIASQYATIHHSVFSRLSAEDSGAATTAAGTVMKLYWAYHNEVGTTQGRLATADEAAAYLDKAREVLRRENLESEARQATLALTEIYWLRGRYDLWRIEVEGLPDRQLPAAEVRERLRQRAHVEYATGRIDNSVRAFKELANHEDSDNATRVKCAIGLLDCYRKLWDVEAARLLFEEMRPKAEGHNLGSLLRGMAAVEVALGDATRAKALYNEAVNYFASVDFYRAHCLRGLGDVQLRLAGEATEGVERLLQEAEESYDQASQLYDKASKFTGMGRVLVALGRSRLARKRLDDRAVEFLEDALRRSRDEGHRFEQGLAQLGFARWYELRGRGDEEIEPSIESARKSFLECGATRMAEWCLDYLKRRELTHPSID